MKGIILAGGLGQRLSPLTLTTNKCLLPVYNKPMIYYPIETLVKSGIKDILLVCGGNAAGEFLRILGNGEAFGLKHLHYTYQSEPRGIADALGLAEEFVGDDNMCVILADNIFEDTFKDAIAKFECNDVGAHTSGAMIFGTEVSHPEHYGVIIQDEADKVVEIQEKPKNPTTNFIATGLYLYDQTVWGYIKQLTPSARGELEITDVNNHYIKKGAMMCHKLNGWWADCGENFDGYLDACNKARSLYKKNHK
jgi:glucose-1-phosphate thymidylyltransferase